MGHLASRQGYWKWCKNSQEWLADSVRLIIPANRNKKNKKNTLTYLAVVVRADIYRVKQQNGKHERRDYHMRHSVVAALVASFLLLLTYPVWSAQTQPAQKATYAGDAVCKACHAAQVEKFSKTVMGKIFASNPRNDLEKQNCESCHGPGSNHVSAGGGKGVGGLITFRKNSGESAKAQNESCLQCHQRGGQTYWEAR